MNAERAAEMARRELGLGVDGPVPDLLRQLEDEAKLLVFIVPLGDGGIDGAYQQLKEERFALINQDKSPVRKRFTLAHEFGHDFLRHGSRVDREISFSDADHREREANGFAAALLAPRPAIDQWLARNDDPDVDLEVVVRLAKFFNVSAYVILYRLQSMGRIAQRGSRELDARLDAREHLVLSHRLGLGAPQDSISVQDRMGGYVPVRMQATIGDLLRRNLLTEEAAAALLRVSSQAAAEMIQSMVEPPSPTDEASGG